MKNLGVTNKVYDPICGNTSFNTITELRKHLVSEHSDCIISKAPSKSNVESQYGIGNIKAVVTLPNVTVAPVQTGYENVGVDEIKANIQFEGVNPVTIEEVDVGGNLQNLGTSGYTVSSIAKVWYYKKVSAPVMGMNLGKVALWGVGLFIVGYGIWYFTSGKNKKEEKGE